MASTSSLVSKLPQRLQNFFARYPPQIYSAAVRPPLSPEQQQAAAESPTATNPDELTETPYTPNRDAKGNKRPDPTVFSPSRALLHSDPAHPNPFLPFKSPRTNTWISPRIGLRRQAELVKLAIRYNVEALLPPGRKSTEFKETRRAERGGLAVKGTGVGQKVKGHKWERTMETRLDERRKAMMEMPEMIRLWKQVSSFSFSRVEKSLWTDILFHYYREVMDVAGSSGPEGGANYFEICGSFFMGLLSSIFRVKLSYESL